MPTTENFNLEWDKTGERFYETGVDRGVIYPQQNDGTYTNGEAWNGLAAVTEKPSGAEENPIWADNMKYLSLFSKEDFGATIEAYTYPDAFALCDGSAELVTGAYVGQQKRKTFGFCYRSRIGNDVLGDSYGYKLHLIYGAKASPTERAFNTVNDSPAATTMSWDLTTTPVTVSGMDPTAIITIDSTKVNATKLGNLEQILYGTPAAGQTAAIPARLPLPAEVLSTLS